MLLQKNDSNHYGCFLISKHSFEYQKYENNRQQKTKRKKKERKMKENENETEILRESKKKE